MDDVKITIRTGSESSMSQVQQVALPLQMPQAQISQVPQATNDVVAPTNATSDNDKTDDSKYVTIKSPIIGTFYRRPSPDKPIFAEVGQDINEGDVLCIIEAMKLFNEIESEVSGKIVKILVDDASPVEFDQPLFLVDPS